MKAQHDDDEQGLLRDRLSMTRFHGHLTMQVPASQYSSVPQALPHEPQWDGSTMRSQQIPEHIVRLGVQDGVHTPAEQISPLAHSVPHVPQLR